MSSHRFTSWGLVLPMVLACGSLSIQYEDDDAGSVSGAAGGSSGSGVNSGGAGTTVGAGAGAPVEDVCDPYAPRTEVPEVLIGPTGLESKLLELIAGAQISLDVLMYQFTQYSFVDALVAAQQGGVQVRVLVDADQTVNQNAINSLSTAGIEVRYGPAEFEHAHAKTILIDGTAAVVMSANLNQYSMATERNYGVIDRDLADIQDLQNIFEHDWNGGGTLDLSCTRLLVSPVNAKEQLLTLILQAEKKLDLAVMYISDTGIREAVAGRAQAGVPVRVMLADPAWIDSNPATASELSAAGVEVKYLKTWELHAKLIVADDVAFVGSENLSWTALNKNREIGLLITESGPAQAFQQQFEQDWSSAVTAP